MTILCVDGNIPPSDFLDVLDWDDVLVLVEMVQDRRNTQFESLAELLGGLFRQALKSDGQIIKAINNMGTNIAKALGAR